MCLMGPLWHCDHSQQQRSNDVVNVVTTSLQLRDVTLSGDVVCLLDCYRSLLRCDSLICNVFFVRRWLFALPLGVMRSLI